MYLRDYLSIPNQLIENLRALMKKKNNLISLMDDIISKHSHFDSLNARPKIVFLFDSIDAFVCKKLGRKVTSFTKLL